MKDDFAAETVAHEGHAFVVVLEGELVRDGGGDVEATGRQQSAHRIPGFVEATAHDTLHGQPFEDHIFGHVQFDGLRGNAH